MSSPSVLSPFTGAPASFQVAGAPQKLRQSLYVCTSKANRLRTFKLPYSVEMQRARCENLRAEGLDHHSRMR